MSLTAKIEKEIKSWEDKITLKKAQVKRMELEIRTLRHLLNMAQELEQ